MNFGRPDYFKMGDWNALCWECGRKRKASSLKKHWQGYYVCPEHWEPRQPQDFVRAVPDIITPPWVQPPVEEAATVLYTPFLGVAPRDAFFVIHAGTQQHADRLAAIKSAAAGTSNRAMFNSLIDSCWLTQCTETISTTEVVAEVGSNGIPYSTGFSADGAVTFLAAPTVLGRWQTPTSNRVGVAVASTNWRVETFVRFSGSADNTGDFIEITPVGGAVGSFHVYFGWGSSGVSQVLMDNYSTTYGAGGGNANSTMARPNSTSWYHVMLQNSTVNKNFMLTLDGVSIWGHGGGATQVWDAGTSLEVAFRTTLGSAHNWGGAVIRCGLPNSAIYNYPGQNISVFTPPTLRLPRYYAPF